MNSVEETLQVQLADQYLLDQLSPERAAQAERAILADPRLQRRAAVTQRLIAALSAGTGAEAKPAVSSTPPGFTWLGVACSAAVVTLAVAGIAWWASGASWNGAPASAVGAHTLATANVASVELGLTRGAGVVPRLELRSDQTMAIVALDVGIPETPLYRVQIHTADGELIWSTHSARPAEDERIYLALKTKRIGSGQLHFSAQPADGLGNELRLPLQILYSD